MFMHATEFIKKGENLTAFVRESNRIEGISEWSDEEVDLHWEFLKLEKITIEAIEAFVWAISIAQLRCETGMNVRVGSHIPPFGGEHIRRDLLFIIQKINEGGFTPYEAHHAYETLHPFMDGNGRSGRVIWLWMMQRELGAHNMDAIYQRGFLHSWYYQSLEAGR